MMSGFAERMDRIADGITAGSRYSKVTRKSVRKSLPKSCA